MDARLKQYKIIELTTVTDEDLEREINRWAGDGWELDDIRFVVTPHSRRPSMAFVSMVRDAAAD